MTTSKERTVRLLLLFLVGIAVASGANSNIGNTIVAQYFSGDCSNCSNIPRANVTGQASIDAWQNTSLTAQGNNDSYFNGTSFPKSADFSNSSILVRETVSNKSTSTSLGTSDGLYPSQNAVKSYVDTQISGVGGFTTQTDVTSSRAIGTIYHNTDSKDMMVVVYARSASNADFCGVTDSSATPTTSVTCTKLGVGGDSNAWSPITFSVLPNNYYKTTQSTGSAVVGAWTEWRKT